jgi:hypothetical protein
LLFISKLAALTQFLKGIHRLTFFTFSFPDHFMPAPAVDKWHLQHTCNELAIPKASNSKLATAEDM